jgi:hypothetical protein
VAKPCDDKSTKISVLKYESQNFKEQSLTQIGLIQRTFQTKLSTNKTKHWIVDTPAWDEYIRQLIDVNVWLIKLLYKKTKITIIKVTETM